MSLLTYEDARPYAKAIRDEVGEGHMPPWHAAAPAGTFENERTLSDAEKKTLLALWRPLSGDRPRQPLLRLVESQHRRARPSVPGEVEFLQDTIVYGIFPHTHLLGKAWDYKLVLPDGTTTTILSVPHYDFNWQTYYLFKEPLQVPKGAKITSATFSLADGTVVGTWVAGDTPVTLPSNSAIRISSSLRVRLQRRAPADYEEPYKARASVLRLVTRAKAPARRAWVARVSCGSPWTGRPAQLLALQPALVDAGAVRVWLERAGSPKTILGWFRDFDPRFPRTYWLARPVDFPAEARVLGDAPCELQLTLVSHR